MSRALSKDWWSNLPDKRVDDIHIVSRIWWLFLLFFVPFSVGTWGIFFFFGLAPLAIAGYFNAASVIEREKRDLAREAHRLRTPLERAADDLQQDLLSVVELAEQQVEREFGVAKPPASAPILLNANEYVEHFQFGEEYVVSGRVYYLHEDKEVTQLYASCLDAKKALQQRRMK